MNDMTRASRAVIAALGLALVVGGVLAGSATASGPSADGPAAAFRFEMGGLPTSP